LRSALDSAGMKDGSLQGCKWGLNAGVAMISLVNLQPQIINANSHVPAIVTKFAGISLGIMSFVQTKLLQLKHVLSREDNACLLHFLHSVLKELHLPMEYAHREESVVCLQTHVVSQDWEEDALCIHEILHPVQ